MAPAISQVNPQIYVLVNHAFIRNIPTAGRCGVARSIRAKHLKDLRHMSQPTESSPTGPMDTDIGPKAAKLKRAAESAESPTAPKAAKNTTAKCSQCKGVHEAWHYKCPTRMAMRKQLRELKHQLPHKFIERRSTPQQAEPEEEDKQEKSSSIPNDVASPSAAKDVPISPFDELRAKLQKFPGPHYSVPLFRFPPQ